MVGGAGRLRCGIRPRSWAARPRVHARDGEYLEGSASSAGSEVESTFDDLGEVFHEFALEQSAPSRGVLVWAVPREIGVQGMRARAASCRSRPAPRRRVRGDEQLELLAEPELSICCFRHRGPGLGGPGLDALNQELLRGLWIETDPVPSSTRIGGAFAIRACFIDPRVTEVEVDRLAAAVRGTGDRPLTL